jgi:hypothetical protein
MVLTVSAPTVGFLLAVTNTERERTMKIRATVQDEYSNVIAQFAWNIDAHRFAQFASLNSTTNETFTLTSPTQVVAYKNGEVIREEFY